MMKKGLIISVSGPSGVGKGTVLAQIRKDNPGFGQSVSVTTRGPREGEQEGREYFFRSKDEFMKLVEEKEILEYDEYVGNFYGTPASPLFAMSDGGTDVLLDLTIAGSMALKDKFEQAVTVFLLPPSFDELRRRLEGRGTESQDIVDKRLLQAREEIVHADSFDYVVTNETVEQAAGDIEAIIRAEKLRYARNKGIEEAL